MKKILCIILLIELMGIFATGMNYTRYYANSHCAFEIQVPDEMQLTLNKEISIDTGNERIVLTEGTVIAPTYIFLNDVCFNIESSEKRIHSEWSNFREQDKLNELLNQAELRRQNEQKPIIRRGVVIGLLFCVCWIVVVGLLLWLLTKKKKQKILYIGHTFVSICILSMAVISALAIK